MENDGVPDRLSAPAAENDGRVALLEILIDSRSPPSSQAILRQV